jgi:hypothetical protein
MSKDNSARKRLVVAYYLGEARFDQTRAMELAGYKSDNRTSLTRMATEMFSRSEIKAMIEEQVQTTELTQQEILDEYADLARWDWRDDYTEAKNNVISAKAFDTMMRGKITALAHMMKFTSGGDLEKIKAVKAAIEEDRRQRPHLSEEDRIKEFKAVVDPKMMKEVMRELLESDENRRRLEESEADINRSSEIEVNQN